MFFFYNVLKKLRQLCAEVFFRNLTKVSLQMREGQAECMKKLVSQTITLPAFFIKLLSPYLLSPIRGYPREARCARI